MMGFSIAFIIIVLIVLYSLARTAGESDRIFKYYNGVFNKTQEFGRKENNPLPSKEDNWIIRDKL